MTTALSEAPTSLPIRNDAFRPEYSPKANPHALRKDVESYLAEYRFEVQNYAYELLFGYSEGGYHLLAVDDKETIVDKARRAIDRKTAEGKSNDREKAELKGLRNLERQLQSAGVGDKILWMSPPGLKSDGYGDYGFIFIGKVDQIIPYTQEKHLSMTAVRVERPTLDQFNSALTFLTGHGIKFNSAEQFLANPIVAANFWDDPESVLSYIFNLSQSGEKDLLYRKIVPLLKPQVDEFINLVSQGKPKELLVRALQAIELYALDLKDSFTFGISPLSLYQPAASLQQMTTYYQNQAPPVVAGSCGSTGNSSSGIQTPNIFNKFSTLDDIFSSKNNHEENSCGRCGKENDGHYHCPSCNKAYADETNTPPDQRTKVCSGNLSDGQRCGFKFNC